MSADKEIKNERENRLDTVKLKGGFAARALIWTLLNSSTIIKRIADEKIRPVWRPFD